MSWANIRTQLKTTVEGVAGIGVVHDYQRWTVEADDFDTVFVTGGRVNAWMITRDRSTEEHEASNQDYRAHHVRIFGVYSLDDSDATEKTFSDLMELICDELRGDNDVSGNAESSTPAEVVRDDHTTLSGTLCHFGEITFQVREDRTF